MSDITMSLDDTLELDTIIEESTRASDPIGIIKYEGSDSTVHNWKGIQTHTGIFDPQEAGTYTIPINAQELTVKVTDPSTIPDTPIAESDLIAWFPYENGAKDETSGDPKFGDTTDYSGTVNGATELGSNGVTDILTQSKDSGCFDLDGSDDYIQSDNLDSIDPSSDSFSINLWFNMSTDKKSQIIQYRDGSDRVTIIYDGTNLGGKVIESTTTIGNASTTSFNGSSGWNMVTLVWDAGDSSIKFYYNKNNKSDSNASNYGSDTHTGFQVGRNPDGGRYFNGFVDDVRFYNIALTSKQISDIYDNTIPS